MMDDQQARPLNEWERSLFLILAAEAGLSHENISEEALNNYLVQEMLDGGMGSIRFVTKSGARRCSRFSIAEVWYKDSDGVDVNFALNLDDEGRPAEIDAMKVDASALLRRPLPTELEIRPLEMIRPARK